MHRLSHYTATSPQHFQNFVLFTNYQFYIEEFAIYARELMAKGGGGYEAFVEPGNIVTPAGETLPSTGRRWRVFRRCRLSPQEARPCGITLVNIGSAPRTPRPSPITSPSLRPDAWLMIGHCAGLRNTQALGDYVLAHAYCPRGPRAGQRLAGLGADAALAEVQVALEEAVAEVTGVSG